MASEPEALVRFFSQLDVQVTRVGLEAGPLSQWLHAGMSAAGFESEAGRCPGGSGASGGVQAPSEQTARCGVQHPRHSAWLWAQGWGGQQEVLRGSGLLRARGRQRRPRLRRRHRRMAANTGTILMADETAPVCIVTAGCAPVANAGWQTRSFRSQTIGQCTRLTSSFDGSRRARTPSSQSAR